MHRAEARIRKARTSATDAGPRKDKTFGQPQSTNPSRTNTSRIAGRTATSFSGPLRPRLPPKPVENVPSFPPQRGPIDEHSQLDRGRIPRPRTPPREALVDGPPRCRHGKTSFCLNLAVSLAARRLVPGLPDAADLARNHRPGMQDRPARAGRGSSLPVEPAGAAGGVRYRNVQQIVSSELRSGSSFHKWFTECQRLSVIVPAAKALRNTR